MPRRSALATEPKGFLVHAPTGECAILAVETPVLSAAAHGALTRALHTPPQGVSAEQCAAAERALKLIASLPQESTSNKKGAESGWRPDDGPRHTKSRWASVPAFCITSVVKTTPQPAGAYFGRINPERWGWTVLADLAPLWPSVVRLARAAALDVFLPSAAKINAMAAWAADWTNGVWRYQADVSAADLVRATAYAAFCADDDSDDDDEDSHGSCEPPTGGYVGSNSDGQMLSGARLFDSPGAARRRGGRDAVIVEVEVVLRRVAPDPPQKGRKALSAPPVPHLLRAAIAQAEQSQLDSARGDSDTEMLRRRCAALEARLARYESATEKEERPNDAPTAPAPVPRRRL